ncbi:MAG: TonB-dependent receptor, partial [Bacteroidota bacterium]
MKSNRILFPVMIFLLLVVRPIFAQITFTKSPSNDSKERWNIPEILMEKSAILPANTPDLNSFNAIDLEFDQSSFTQFNQFGSYGYFNNGFTDRLKIGKYRFFFDDFYQNFSGYRNHSNIYGTDIFTGLQINPSNKSRVEILGYYLRGEAKLPGGLNLQEYETDPMQANPRSLHRDEKRAVTRGRVDIRYVVTFGKKENNELLIQGWGKFDDIIRTTEEYKMINKSGFGFISTFTNRTLIADHLNVVTAGIDLAGVPIHTEYYENLAGSKSDMLERITSENIKNNSVWLSDRFEIVKENLYINLTGEFARENYHIEEEILPSRTDSKRFQAFTPKAELDYTPTEWLTTFASYGSSFHGPTEKELESPVPQYLYNQDLKAQTSNDFEIGAKCNWKHDSATFFPKGKIELIIFNSQIHNELVSYEMFLEEFSRNAEKVNRFGVQLKGKVAFIRDLALDFSYSYSDYVYEINTPLIWVGNTQVRADFSGKREPNTALHRYLIGLDYSHYFGAGWNMVAKMNYSRIDELWADDENTATTDASG